jgi:hypothetical protein
LIRRRREGEGAEGKRGEKTCLLQTFSYFLRKGECHSPLLPTSYLIQDPSQAVDSNTPVRAIDRSKNSNFRKVERQGVKNYAD